jgi:hypothetical protein|nr:MAG TPA: tail protein [Caudoviricetes sp.]
MSKTVICKNEDDVQIEFSYEDDAEFFLISLDGAYSVSNNVTTSENTFTDGSTYQGSTTKQRNIVITTEFDEDYQSRRDFLYKSFKPKSPGTLYYTENDEKRQIDYYVEGIEIDEKGVCRNAVISLICPDPFFKDPADTTVTMAGWEPCFEFIHEFTDELEEFSVRIAELVKDIENDSAADHIGIEVLMEAQGAVKNPALYHTQQDIHIQIGTDDYPFNMEPGDVVKITTGTNEKNVYLIKDGTETKINEYLEEESEFIQLIHGKNTFIYDAATGVDYLNVTIKYRFRYLGV